MSHSENDAPKDEQSNIEEKETKPKKKAKKDDVDDSKKPLKVKRQKKQDFVKPSYLVTSSPHVKSKDTIGTVMWSVFFALLPAALWGVYHFRDPNVVKESGMFMALLSNPALHHIIVGVLACIATEYAMNLMRKQKISAFDGSAAVTGLLLAMVLPYKSPLYVTLLSSIFAISVCKHLFGGLGNNFINPALAGRVFAGGCWPAVIYAQDKFLTSTQIDSQTSATVLELMKKIVGEADPSQFQAQLDQVKWLDLAIGNIGGSIGEISAILLLIGAIYLFIKKYITWEIPFTYIGTVFLLTFLIGGRDGSLDVNYALYHVLAGGLVIGAFYMATDMVTSPLTSKGQIIFGVGCGLLTVLIRLYGGYPEGVAFSILLMNLAVPLIDRYTSPRIFGHFKQKKEA